MKVMVLGSDGYIGHTLTKVLLEDGHMVTGVDNYSRRGRVSIVGSNSLTPIESIMERHITLRQKYLSNYNSLNYTLGKSYIHVKEAIRSFQPECIVHLAEQPSAPWSMINNRNAAETQHENVIGTLDILWAMREVCPDAHLLKLGTMGEYGTPNCVIPEGDIPGRCIGAPTDHTQVSDCPMSGLPFPKSPGSFYHLSKVHDTHNITFACKNWGLSSTDIMQGVVYGVKVNPDENDNLTRFDYDEYFGTAINRFCAQAIIGHPLTVYGKGKQTRGFLPLKDSIQCLLLAMTNPPDKGEYRVFNQFEDIYSINTLANIVCHEASQLGLNVSIEHIPNPRKEMEEHYYLPDHNKLRKLGYHSSNIHNCIRDLLIDILPYKDRVNKEVILPVTTWE